jgi:hypothetical protein
MEVHAQPGGDLLRDIDIEAGELVLAVDISEGRIVIDQHIVHYAAARDSVEGGSRLHLRGAHDGGQKAESKSHV